MTRHGAGKEGSLVISAVETACANENLGARIRRNLMEGLEARQAGSTARSRADAFLTSSALLVYEVLRASMEGSAPSPNRAATILAAHGLALPRGRSFHTNIARAIMGAQMGSDRLGRVAYAALEILESGVNEPLSYLKDHGGVGGLAVRRVRRMNPQVCPPGPQVGKASPAAADSFVLVRATKKVAGDHLAVINDCAVAELASGAVQMWILPFTSMLMELIIARAVEPLRQADNPAELVVADESKQGKSRVGRHPPPAPSELVDQPGLPF
ncbi:hypothetical protein VQH23_19680 [Pararoseomonas sp. SCSIO 73927]|uniref:hypothetical protein n=1 Tax=Pararoseomonas sp. SCSIO 73927 TaxID=3114537 RepID=UPI0030CC3945